jgi:hypothetical protein
MLLPVFFVMRGGPPAQAALPESLFVSHHARDRMETFGAVRAFDGQDLPLPAPVAVDGHALAVQAISQAVDLFYVRGCGLSWEVARLGDGVVSHLLEGRLNPDVTLRRNVVGRGEDLLPLLGDLREPPGRPADRDLLHEVLGVEPLPAGRLGEPGVHVRHLHAGLVADERQGEDRLDPSRSVGDDADRPRRRDRRDGGVPPGAFRPWGQDPSTAGTDPIRASSSLACAPRSG